MRNRGVYNMIGGLRPRRSAMNNSFTTLFDCDMGQLIPVHCEECIPGDSFQIDVEAVVRFQPLVAPVLHEIYLRAFYFFVPTRLIMNEQTMDELGDDGTWEDFYTGGDDGNDDTVLPVWGSSNGSPKGVPFPTGGYQKYSLWDYLTHPLGVTPGPQTMPLAFDKRCYNLVYNEYIRDQNIQDEVSLDSDVIQNICWSKDRFTTALYDTQRGNRPAIPLSGLTGIQFNGAISPSATNVEAIGMGPQPTPTLTGVVAVGGQTTTRLTFGGSLPPNFGQTSNVPNGTQRFVEWLNNNSLNLSNAVTFDVIDMRRIFQLQKYMERNMRSGARYTEQLKSRFGVKPQDSRLQRPEFIGAARSPIIISEVLQTSETTGNSPQGQLAGHGISATKTRIGRYRVMEPGYIIGIMCIQPVPIYNLGINAQWLRRTRWDFPTPELVHLSEVAVKNAELRVTGDDNTDQGIFGFQGIYDEMRVKENRVVGGMRDTFDYWHLAREDILNPGLTPDFIKCVPSKRIFAVQDEPGLIVHFANLVRAIRPLPIIAEPGLIDHM
ncbi:major capsid protein [Tortoise microvirus 27]|nr:major capsid protein [Tortoise microvirus 27]